MAENIGNTEEQVVGPVRYDLSPQEIDELQAAMAKEIGNQFGPKEGVYAVWLDPDSPYADIIRTNEAKHWSYVEDIMSKHEDQSKFLALFDTREGLNKVVHGTRISSIRNNEIDEPENAQRTGLIVIDDIIDSNQGVTAKSFREYYEGKGVDLAQCITIETNMHIHKTKHFNGIRLSEVGYIALFEFIDKPDLKTNEVILFAAINRDSINSFRDTVGLEYEPLMGRPDLRVPAVNGKFDDDFEAVAIPTSSKNVQLFRNLHSVAAPSLSI